VRQNALNTTLSIAENARKLVSNARMSAIKWLHE
jgi:hypothetical protein